MINMISPFETKPGKCSSHELLQGMRLTCSNHEIVGLLSLKDAPHRVDIFWRPAPIAVDREVSQAQPLGGASRNTISTLYDLLCYEACGSKIRLVIEKNSIGREHPMGFTVIPDQPMGGRLGDCIRAHGIERRGLVGRRSGGIAEALA
jgi:hypothetical protein